MRAKLPLLAAGSALIPAVAAFLYVGLYGVNAPVQDQWETVRLLLADAAGKLSFTDLVAQHNEHRILFPRLVMLALGKTTHYDTVAEMWVTECALLLALAVLVLALRRTFVRTPWFLLPLVGFLVFSLRQHETMLLGFNIGFAFVAAFGLLALYFLRELDAGRWAVPVFVGALASATIASFSGLQGLLVWPAGLIVLVLGSGLRKLWPIPAWLAVGTTEWVLYLHGYHRPAIDAPVYYPLEHPAAALDYLITLTGGALFQERWVAFAFGVFLLLAAVSLVVASLRSSTHAPDAFWIGLLSFSALILLSITSGRTRFGISTSLSSRYSTYSLLFAAALLALAARLAFEHRSRLARGIVAVLAGSIIASMVVSYDQGLTAGRQTRFGRQLSAFYLATYRTEPDAILAAIYPSPTAVRLLAPGLERLHYSVFAERGDGQLPPRLADLEPDGASSECTIDEINQQKVGLRRSLRVTLPSGATVVDASGWCIDSAAKRQAGGVYLVLDGRPYPAFYGLARADVARFFKTSHYRRTGFARAIRVAPLPAGKHTLAAIAVSTDGSRRYRLTPTFVLAAR